MRPFFICSKCYLKFEHIAGPFKIYTNGNGSITQRR